MDKTLLRTFVSQVRQGEASKALTSLRDSVTAFDAERTQKYFDQFQTPTEKALSEQKKKLDEEFKSNIYAIAEKNKEIFKTKINKAIVELDEDHGKKLEEILENLDNHHSDKLEKVIAKLDEDYTQKLEKLHRKVKHFIRESDGDNDFDDRSENETQELYFKINDNGDTTIVKLSRDDGEWHESLIAGKEPYGFGSKTYMSYLKPEEIKSWLQKDYSDVTQISEDELESELSQLSGESTSEETIEECDKKKAWKDPKKEKEIERKNLALLKKKDPKVKKSFRASLKEAFESAESNPEETPVEEISTKENPIEEAPRSISEKISGMRGIGLSQEDKAKIIEISEKLNDPKLDEVIIDNIKRVDTMPIDKAIEAIKSISQGKSVNIEPHLKDEVETQKSEEEKPTDEKI